MQRLAQDGVSPSVVSDQVGRLTFATEIARAARHLLETHAPYGTYNLTNDGPATSWADLAKTVFHAERPLGGRRHPGHDRGVRRGRERGAATAQQRARPVADPVHGFEPTDAGEELQRYVRGDSSVSASRP